VHRRGRAPRATARVNFELEARMIQKSLALGVLLALLAGTAAAADDDDAPKGPAPPQAARQQQQQQQVEKPQRPPLPWKRRSFGDDLFQAEFPGAVQASRTELPAKLRPLVRRAVTYMQAGTDHAFAVGVQHHKKPLDLAEALQDAFGNLACASVEDPVPIPIAGGTGRELHGTDCLGGDFEATMRTFQRDLTLYQVLAIFKTGGEDDATRFLNSFRMLQPAS
jgi:hypothetical protein